MAQTIEERRAANREANKRWLAKNPDYIKNYRATHREQLNAKAREYQAKRRQKQRDWMNNYHQTKEGRATNLLNSYIQMDLEAERGLPNLTRDDIMRKCFSETSKCVYCGETDWHVLGLDRIDNSRPHDAVNCVCSCHDCNVKRYRKPLREYIGTKGLAWDQWMAKNDMSYAEPTIKIEYQN